MRSSKSPVRRVEVVDPDAVGALEWPRTIPAVDAVWREGLDLDPGITLLVGENGSGKSTLVEAVAVAYGLSPEGGSNQGVHSTRPSESGLGEVLRVERDFGSPRWGFFLRAETMHGWYTYSENLDRDDPSAARRRAPGFHEMSHGESFLEVITQRFNSPGFYCLDEPEAALSFSSQLALAGALQDLVARGSQVLCATHSPLLAAIPGATLLEVGDWGLRRTTWDELDLVWHWRQFLGDPQRYWRHLAD